MCRALKVLCVAPDTASLAELKRAATSAEWELMPGAVTEEEAMRQLRDGRPHVVVAFGAFGGFVASALEASPALRVVADREMPGTGAVAASMDEVRAAIKGRPRPGGPVR